MVSVSSSAGEVGLVILIILVGFLCGKTKYVSVNRDELGEILSRIVLPTLFFYSFISIDFGSLSIAAIVGGMLSCLIIMLICLVFTWLFNRDLPIDTRLKQWAIYSIFITMTYDMSIGLTISEAVWDNNDDTASDSSTDYSQYIIMWSAISRVLNLMISVGILDVAAFLENERVTGRLGYNGIGYSVDSYENNDNSNENSHCKTTFKRCLTNPTCLSLVFGIIFNIVFAATLDSSIPSILESILDVMSEGYSFLSLFLIGFGIAQTQLKLFKHKSRARTVLSHRKSVVVACFLLCAKLILSPFLYYWIIYTLTKNDDRIDSSSIGGISCFYGALPTSGFVYIMALRYRVHPNVIGIASIVCLFISIPSLFGITILFKNPSEIDFNNAATYFAYDSHLASMTGLVILFCGFTIFQYIGEAWRNSSSMQVVSFVGLTQFFYHFCGVLCQVSNHFNSEITTVIYWIEWYFRICCHFWIFSLLLITIHYGPIYYHRSNLDTKFIGLIHCISWTLPLIVVVLSAVVSIDQNTIFEDYYSSMDTGDSDGDTDDYEYLINKWQCGVLYIYQSFILLFIQLMFIIILFFGIIYYHYPKSNDLITIYKKDHSGRQDSLLGSLKQDNTETENESLYLQIDNDNRIDFNAKLLGNLIARVEPSSRDAISSAQTPVFMAHVNNNNNNNNNNKGNNADSNDSEINDLNLSSEEILEQQKAYIAMTQIKNGNNNNKNKNNYNNNDNKHESYEIGLNDNSSNENNHNDNKKKKKGGNSRISQNRFKASFNTTLSSDLYDKPPSFDSKQQQQRDAADSVNTINIDHNSNSNHIIKIESHGQQHQYQEQQQGHHANMDTLQQLQFAHENVARSMTESTSMNVTPQSTLRADTGRNELQFRKESSYNNDDDAKLDEIDDENAYVTPGGYDAMHGFGNNGRSEQAGTVIVRKDSEDSNVTDDDNDVADELNRMGHGNTTRGNITTINENSSQHYNTKKHNNNHNHNNNKYNGLSRGSEIVQTNKRNNNSSNSNNNKDKMNNDNYRMSSAASTGRKSVMPLKYSETDMDSWRNVRTSQLTSHFYVAAMIVITFEIIRLICETIVVIYIIQDNVSRDDGFDTLSFINVILVETQGLITAIAFGWNEYFQMTFTSVLRSICCFCKNVKNIRTKNKYVKKGINQHDIHNYLEL